MSFETETNFQKKEWIRVNDSLFSNVRLSDEAALNSIH